MHRDCRVRQSLNNYIIKYVFFEKAIAFSSKVWYDIKAFEIPSVYLTYR